MFWETISGSLALFADGKMSNYVDLKAIIILLICLININPLLLIWCHIWIVWETKLRPGIKPNKNVTGKMIGYWWCNCNLIVYLWIDRKEEYIGKEIPRGTDRKMWFLTSERNVGDMIFNTIRWCRVVRRVRIWVYGSQSHTYVCPSQTFGR